MCPIFDLFPPDFMPSQASFLAWEPLDGAARERFLERLSYRGPVELLLAESARLPFYDGVWIVALWVSGARKARFFLYVPEGDDKPAFLNGTNWSIYTLNLDHPPRLSPENIRLYVRFFFYFVRGSLGGFEFVETASDVAWRDHTAEADKAAVARLLSPMDCRGLGPDNFYRLTGMVVFKNALFKTDILVADDHMWMVDDETETRELFDVGQVRLTNESLLLDHIPVDIWAPDAGAMDSDLPTEPDGWDAFMICASDGPCPSHRPSDGGPHSA